MPEVKFYDQGRVPGDWMLVLDRIEAKKEWAIVLDHSEPRAYQWRVFVKGVSCGPCGSQREAEILMRRYLDGQSPIPQ
jgi:hypothetical protein